MHATAKRMLHQRIEAALNDNAPIPISWQCQKCECNHTGDLLKKVSGVHLETFIKGPNIRPDLLLSREGEPYKLLEIVHTHSPDKSVHDYAKTEGLQLLIFTLTNTEDISRIIQAPVLSPATHNVIGCRCEFCPHCHSVRVCKDEHKYCETCHTCVENWSGQHGEGGDHKHCRFCDEVITYPDSNSVHHCCDAAKRYGVPVCRDKNEGNTHRHCDSCGERISTTAWSPKIYNRRLLMICSPCHTEAVRKPVDEWERSLEG